MNLKLLKEGALKLNIMGRKKRIKEKIENKETKIQYIFYGEYFPNINHK